MTEETPIVQMIPIEQIHILNPRTRNKATFQDITSNISNVGLKKPITVARREPSPEGKPYDLACGQGRLEAYMALGQTEIPAIVIEATREECYLMSLTENLARGYHAPLELMREINNLKSRGYNTTEIAKKIDLAKGYVVGIAHLLDRGEERLLAAVDKGRIPLSVAMDISTSDDAGIQQALCDAYENKSLRGRKLLTVRKIIEQRKTKGKRLNHVHRPKDERAPTAEALVRVYRQEADRQREAVKRARLTQSRLLFIVTALKKLLHDDNFLTLLKAEQLETLPAYLAERIHAAERA